MAALMRCELAPSLFMLITAMMVLKAYFPGIMGMMEATVNTGLGTSWRRAT